VVTTSEPKQCVNVNNVRSEASRYFRNKNKEYKEAKIDELESDSKIKNIRNLYKGMSDSN
jgi:hypothetical protein